MHQFEITKPQPQNLEQALWDAIDHARRYNEREVEAELMLIMLNFTNRWTYH